MHERFDASSPGTSGEGQGGSAPDPELRRALLLSLGILDTGPEAAFDGLARVAALVTGCPAAVLSLAVGSRLWAKASHGGLAADLLQECAASGADSLLELDWLELTDPAPGLRLPQGQAAAPGLRYYAGLPVKLEGVPVGVLCVMDTEPRLPMGAAARQGLEALGTAVEALLLSRRPGAAADAQALARRQALLARASHEMRTPLNALRGFAQLLRLDAHVSANPRTADWVGQIEKASAHLLGLVEQLLELARLQGAPPLEQRRCELPAMLRDGVALLAPAAAARRVQLVLQPADEGTDWGVLADEQLLRRLLLQLLAQAIEHASPGTAPALRLQAQGDMRGFSIDDPAPELAACQDLVRALRGRIEVQPGGQAGCTVGVQLPAAAS